VIVFPDELVRKLVLEVLAINVELAARDPRQSDLQQRAAGADPKTVFQVTATFEK
jgi:hypothetical protein